MNKENCIQDLIKAVKEQDFKVGDKLTIPHLYVNSCNGFDLIDLYNVNVIAVKVGKDEVLFNFENALFTHSIDENYEVGASFKSTQLGIYLQTIFAKGLSKSINVKVKDCSLLTCKNIFNSVSDEYIGYFEPIKNRIKAFKEENGIAWWLSTPSTSNAASFCGVSNYGGSSYYYASNSYGGVAPAFLITAKKEIEEKAEEYVNSKSFGSDYNNIDSNEANEEIAKLKEEIAKLKEDVEYWKNEYYYLKANPEEA